MTPRIVVPVPLLVLALVVGACNGGTTATTVPVTTVPATSTTTTAPTTTTTVPLYTEPWTVTDDGVWITEYPHRRDPESYAAHLGITVAEAEYRNRLIGELAKTNVLRWISGASWTAGVWIEETAEWWHLVVATVDIPFAERGVSRRLNGTEVLDLVVFREVEHSLGALEQNLSRLESLIDRWCLPPLTTSEVDLLGNRMVVGVHDLTEFLAAVETVKGDLREVVVQEHPVSPPPERNTDGCPLMYKADLEAARQRWESFGIDNYRFVVEGGSHWGTAGRYLVIVTADDIALQVLEPPTGVFADRTWTRDFDAMFRWADTAWQPGTLYVRIHPEWGFVTSLGYDHPGVIDDGWGYRMTAFAPAGEPLTLTDPDRLPCYYSLDQVQHRSSDLDRDLIDRAARIALEDRNLLDLLIPLNSGCQTMRVVLPDTGPGIWVIANISPPVDRDQWPREVCGTEMEQISSIRWTVDLDKEEVLSVCGY